MVTICNVLNNLHKNIINKFKINLNKVSVEIRNKINIKHIFY